MNLTILHYRDVKSLFGERQKPPEKNQKGRDMCCPMASSLCRGQGQAAPAGKVSSRLVGRKGFNYLLFVEII